MLDYYQLLQHIHIVHVAFVMIVVISSIMQRNKQAGWTRDLELLQAAVDKLRSTYQCKNSR